MKFHIAGADTLMLQEIANKECTRDVVARTYAFALRSDHPCDFKKVNKAIIERWSLSALEYIKKMAWTGKCFEE